MEKRDLRRRRIGTWRRFLKRGMRVLSAINGRVYEYIDGSVFNPSRSFART